MSATFWLVILLNDWDVDGAYDVTSMSATVWLVILLKDFDADGAYNVTSWSVDPNIYICLHNKTDIGL